MLSQLKAISLFGLQAEKVMVEVDVHPGKVMMTIVGLADAAVQESKERLRSAIKNSGFQFPLQRVAINLAPAEKRKQGAYFDLAMAVGMLQATKQLSFDAAQAESTFLLGELGFNGDLRPVSGVLPLAFAAKKLGFKSLVVPAANRQEAALVPEIEVYGATNLKEACQHLSGEAPLAQTPLHEIEPSTASWSVDMADIEGQESAKRALEVAAAGGHNVLMVGPPGSGKTMLARALTSILPSLSVREALEVTQLYSIAGLINETQPVITARPFRAVHHTASGVAIVGGGNPPRPGEISLSHRGVLFLDEFAEFPIKTLEVLRQPLEDGHITVSRAAGSLHFPSQIMLVAAMNPCPCGFFNDPEKPCTCPVFQRTRYQQKISGPILDRIDLHMTVPRVQFMGKTNTKSLAENSATIQARVEKARQKQKARLQPMGKMNNAEMSSAEVKTLSQASSEALTFLRATTEQRHLSGRAYYRLLKVSRTIADLDDSDSIELPHLAEAVSYRDMHSPEGS